MRNSSVLNSPRLLEIKKKRNKVLRRKAFFLIFLFLLILVGLSFLSKWQEINISDIKITGNKVIETKVIEDIVREKLAGNYLWFFPKTNSIIYPKAVIKKELDGRFKRIKDISFGVENLKILNISLTERNALYTYCGAVIEEGSKCYFMDESGYIFDEAPFFSGEVYLKFYSKATNPDNPSDSYFFQSNFSQLISFNETAKKIGIKPTMFLIQDNGDVEMFLSSSSASQQGPRIIFKSDSDFAKVAENLQSVLTTEPLQTDFKKKYSSLLYIDLRFGNKVYYKFR